MFRGHFYRSLDPKGRLMLPAEFRDGVAPQDAATGAPFMLTNFDGCAVGYPLAEWEEVEAGFARMNMLDPRVRKLHRFFIGGAVEVSPDKQGRIMMPPHLRKYADLEKDVVVAGVGRKFEVWNKAAFEAQFAETEAGFEADMTALAGEGFELKL